MFRANSLKLDNLSGSSLLTKTDCPFLRSHCLSIDLQEEMRLCDIFPYLCWHVDCCGTPCGSCVGNCIVVALWVQHPVMSWRYYPTANALVLCLLQFPFLLLGCPLSFRCTGGIVDAPVGTGHIVVTYFPYFNQLWISVVALISFFKRCLGWGMRATVIV